MFIYISGFEPWVIWHSLSLSCSRLSIYLSLFIFCTDLPSNLPLPTYLSIVSFLIQVSLQGKPNYLTPFILQVCLQSKLNLITAFLFQVCLQGKPNLKVKKTHSLLKSVFMTVSRYIKMAAHINPRKGSYFF